jgi:hypothetical protein
MYEQELPFTLKICYAFFFLQGALGMLLSIVIWFSKEESFTYKLVFFVIMVLYFVLNIEIGKGLKKLKKWSFVAAIILCLLQTISVFIGYSDFSLFTIASIIVVTLLFTVKNRFWKDDNDIYKDEIVT